MRVCYRIIIEKIYNPQYSKVIFVLHSQGAIEGSLILDWLLQELPRDLLSKLEVYTFGNAANHFNNPHGHKRSQTMAKRNPLAACIDSTRLASHEPTVRVRHPQPRARPSSSSSSSSDAEPYTEAQPLIITTAATTSYGATPIASTNGTDTTTSANGTTNSTTNGTTNGTTVPTTTTTPISLSTTTPHPSHLSDRVIGHIEHYAHTTDFVALWGVLHFATAFSSPPTSTPHTTIVPRFLGRVFSRTSPRGGHQMVQHYLDGMFPLQRDAVTGRLVRDKNGIPLGAADGEGTNPFMESLVQVGGGNDGTGREQGAAGETDTDGVEVRGISPVLERGGSTLSAVSGVSASGAGVGERKETGVVTARVRELSRLWQYRNGRSPGGETPPGLVRGGDGVVRGATM